MYTQFILAIGAAVKMLSGIDVCYLSYFWRANKLPCIPKKRTGFVSELKIFE